MFRKRKRAEVERARVQAQQASAPFGQVSLEDLQAWHIVRRGELDEIVRERKLELAALGREIDRKLARQRFTQLLDDLPPHEVDVLSDLLIEEG